MEAYITIGASASGKTTWAEKKASNPNWVNVNRDDVRKEILSIRGIDFSWDNWFKWARKNKGEDLVTQKCRLMIKLAAANGMNLIVSDTNLHYGRLIELEEFLRSLGYNNPQRKFFNVEFAELCRRDAARENGVGSSVIAKQIEQYESLMRDLKQGDQMDTQANNPDAIIFDVDGTLAHMNGRSPFDWGRVNEDTPDPALFKILNALLVTGGVTIIILSGRDGICKDETFGWIAQYVNVNQDKILHYQRATGDNRKDTIIKEELYNSYIKDNFNVIGVFDDRPVVCRMWRSLGLPVFQCGNPYIEF